VFPKQWISITTRLSQTELCPHTRESKITGTSFFRKGNKTKSPWDCWKRSHNNNWWLKESPPKSQDLKFSPQKLINKISLPSRVKISVSLMNKMMTRKKRSTSFMFRTLGLTKKIWRYPTAKLLCLWFQQSHPMQQ
jgi:hypothetical protein